MEAEPTHDLVRALVLRRRRIAIGAACGSIAGALWLSPAFGAIVAIVVGAAVGASFAATLHREGGSWEDGAFTAAALGIGCWCFETFLDREPNVARLIAWTLYGASVGASVAVVRVFARRAFGPEPAGEPARAPAKRRIAILGGGFAGVTVAREIERRIGGDPSIDVTIVSDRNALLFTPMLAEVAASSVEPTHITSPVRTSVRRSTVVLGRVTAIDLDERSIALDGGTRTLTFDHVVVALGARSNDLGLADIARYAMTFRSLGDAIAIRNRVIAMLERADREPDPIARRTFLTFVVAGGGFAGAELAGALNDFTRGALADYRNLVPAEVAIVVVHAGERILPELGPSLGTYAQTRMTARGVTFRMKRRVAGAGPDSVRLDDDTTIAAHTLVWTAGIKPHELAKSLGVEVDRRGAIVVDETLAVAGRSGVWALGDCASAIDPATGRPHPPTAQVAIRQAHAVARNVCATLAGGRATPARVTSVGALCVVGFRTACAELQVPFARGRAVRFSGTFAWLLWRGVYLAKLPGVERQTRVLFDWVVELFVPRDIVQTLELD